MFFVPAINIIPKAATGYTGPGDVISGAAAFWGLRGYNAAYATGSNPAIDVVDTATELITTTINILSDGSLDVATISGLGYGVSVKKLYDQIGTNYITFGSNKLPVLTLSGIGSLPVMTFDSAVPTWGTSVTNLGLTHPLSISAVAKSVNNGTLQNLIYFTTTIVICRYNRSGANTVSWYAGSFLDSSATDGSWHALAFLSNSTVSKNVVDGSATTGDAGTNEPNSGLFILSTDGNPGVNGFKGAFVELGAWSGDKSASFSSLSTNQHAYWGF